MSDEKVTMCDLCRKIDGVRLYSLVAGRFDTAGELLEKGFVAAGDLCPAHAKRAVDFFKKGLRNPGDKPRAEPELPGPTTYPGPDGEHPVKP